MALPKPNGGVVGPADSIAPDLWRGIVACIPALDGTLYDYAERAVGTRVGAPTIIGMKPGRAVNFPSSAGATFADSLRYRAPSSAITIAVAYTKTAINLFDSGHVLGKGGANINEGSWSINTVDDDTQNPRFTIATGDSTPVTTAAVAVTQNTPVLAVGRWMTTGPLELRVYDLRTGALIGSASSANTTATINYTNPGTVNLAHRGSGGGFIQGHFYGGYVWSRRLADGEVLALVQDPWVLVRPRREVGIDAPAGGGGGVTGTGAATFGALSVAGSGDVLVKGTGAVTFGALSVSAAGDVPRTGTGTITFGALAASGSGALLSPGSGTGALTFGALTVAGAGDVLVRGVAALSFGPVAVAGVGDVPRTGTAAITFPALLVSARTDAAQAISTGQRITIGIGIGL